MQHSLGESGVSPKIYGVILEKDIEELLFKFPEMRNDQESYGYSFGILMDLVEDAWNPTRGSGSLNISEQAVNWNAEHIKEQIFNIEELLNKFRIAAGDTEFLINKLGRVFLIDLDRSTWISKDNVPYGYFADDIVEEEDFIRAVENANGNPIPIINDFSKVVAYVFDRLSEVKP